MNRFSSGVSPHAELSAFLRAQRERLRPEDVGLVPDAVPRRVPGLRREEVARLAGVSTDYYTRLEQGRKFTPSDGVVNAIARALRMDDAAREHLFDLIRLPTASDGAPPVQRVRWANQQLIDSWTAHAALITGRGHAVLATNALARALLTDFNAMPTQHRNYIRWLILDPAAAPLFADWETVASEMVAALRLDAGKHPDDRGILDLVGELAVKSEQFRTWWADQRVVSSSYGVKRFQHPVVGDLELNWQGLALPGDEDQTIFIYFPEPNTRGADALALLASWSAAPTAASADTQVASSEVAELPASETRD
ncbi:helix-turn-helix transcriptional regulator [Curtobacterium sp. ISL-83]|uniref:helix-turn-helix transcriptional regulator n=1 Tax=Curtobacterium sp. ISL-83 TaxID=2819145 RepID=UPI001BED0717|nr:helix-turn-helix transcriptional regulator [Curtobacterium sp. ISL-83]MBT2501700.1 helix-turn-helix domain-containing protein [Curtobacterium sp. ISL-83]